MYVQLSKHVINLVIWYFEYFEEYILLLRKKSLIYHEYSL
jgi:hypothetical protein